MQMIKELLLQQQRLYPGLELQDCLKLLYQNELGGGHLIQDEAAFCERLQQERQQVDFSTTPREPEDIGNGLYRIHLAGVGNTLVAQTLTRICAISARKHVGSLQNLQKKLAMLQTLIQQGKLPYSAPQALEEIAQYIQAGCPQTHHSARFVALYQPHYRLVTKKFALVLPVFAAIDKELQGKSHVLVAIDGMAAAGKSSLAKQLAQVYGSGTVEVDDFFLQHWQRTPQRLAEAGGNIDYERLAPVVQQAAAGQGVCYQGYNCATGQTNVQRTLPAGRVTVVEGSYSMHPRLNAPYDVKVFLQVDATTQAGRILQRNGQAMAQRFTNEWIPMENQYFAEFKVREGCDVVIDTSNS
ncbi:hypothetical protein LJC61_07350 [Ruminococcaceae bacterium OttesenSCG-928-A16]|nr:hypothetical protein [Ruminococcaceae bacterium OttesenSCG-928-A16]